MVKYLYFITPDKTAGKPKYNLIVDPLCVWIYARFYWVKKKETNQQVNLKQNHNNFSTEKSMKNAYLSSTCLL